jgi:hypothetical protein
MKIYVIVKYLDDNDTEIICAKSSEEAADKYIEDLVKEGEYKNTIRYEYNREVHKYKKPESLTEPVKPRLKDFPMKAVFIAEHANYTEKFKEYLKALRNQTSHYAQFKKDLVIRLSNGRFTDPMELEYEDYSNYDIIETELD